MVVTQQERMMSSFLLRRRLLSAPSAMKMMSSCTLELSDQTSGTSYQGLGSSIHLPLFCVIKSKTGLFTAEVSMYFVTGVEIAFVGLPEQSSQSLTRSTLHNSKF